MKIDYLKLYTPRLEEQLRFYSELLGLRVKKKEADFFELEVGFSTLRFQSDPTATPYHVAFHIPAFQIEKALLWLKRKLPVLKKEGQEIIDFPAWNAESVYFYDLDENIIELISRKHFPGDPSQDFSAAGVRGVAEIGLATSDVEAKFSLLNKSCNTGIFSGDKECFCAVGDEQGLFILINRNLKTWIPTGDVAWSSAFEAYFSHKDNRYGISYKNDLLLLI